MKMEHSTLKSDLDGCEYNLREAQEKKDDAEKALEEEVKAISDLQEQLDIEYNAYKEENPVCVI